MNEKQRKALGRAFLTIARESKTLGEAGIFEIRSVYKPALERIEKAAMDVVETLREKGKAE